MEYLEDIFALFEQWCGRKVESSSALTQSGSNRRYYRLKSGDISVIACRGEKWQENRAFVEMNRLFRAQGHPVPEVYAQSESGMIYLQQDLGDESLFDKIMAGENVDELIHETLSALAKLQVRGAEGMDWDWCYPQKELDLRTIRWDLNYFKYAFLKPAGAIFDENQLQDAFDMLEKDLMSVRGDFFLYRDFQSRNVMVSEGKIYFIDFQGGRKGNVFYDVASFLFQARSGFSREQRLTYLKHYRETLLQELSEADKQQDWVHEEAFLKHFYHYAFFRLMQVMGAYGYRGWFERKSHFIKSIPPAMEALSQLLEEESIRISVHPYLLEVLGKMVDHFKKDVLARVDKDAGSLHVQVYSFSYHKGIPEDYSGNGGGFVFDCRGMHNPGRYEEYKALTGLDVPVIRFLEDQGEIQPFLEHVQSLVVPAIDTYLKRGFSHLMICFGCTGGRHRSVYSAQKTAEFLAQRFPELNVSLNHREQQIRQEFSKGARL